jgi:coenzyme F420-0:L-glutamate ligase
VKRPTLSIIPLEAPVRQARFDLIATLDGCLAAADVHLHEGDILAISSKYTAIAEGRVVRLDEVHVTPAAYAIADRYQMNPTLAQVVIDHADHVFGGIPGFLLTHKEGIISPNAGIDRSNIPAGYAVLFPADPYATAAALRAAIRDRFGVRVGIILTDSWLMPGRAGTTGVSLASAGFNPVSDERGMTDLFGNIMQVTRRSVTDQLCAAAQLVMGERDEAIPFAIVRGTGIVMSDDPVTLDQVAYPWHECIYVQSLTEGRLTAEEAAAL